MNILLIYSSKTGNTQKVAQAIGEALSVVPTRVEDNPSPKGYDWIIAGFWVDRGTADGKMKAYLQKLTGQKVALFATLGAEADSEHAAKCLDNGAALLGEGCTVVGLTASRTEQELKETPTAAEVITREELERTGANTLTEALKRSANINVTQSAMGNNVSLRGMNNNQTLILINGRRIRTEDTNDSANKYELNRVNMANVDHIEIIRGAASSLYGSEAMGGVINIITKKDAKESVTFGGDWTTHETDAYFHASTGKIGKWAVDIDGKYSKARNWGYLGSTAQVISMGGSNTYSMVTQSTNQYGERYFFDIDGRYAIDKDKEWDIFFDYMREDLKSQSMTAHVLNMPPYMNNRTVLTAGYLNLFDHERWTAGTGYKGKDSRGDYELRAYFIEFNKDQKVYYSYYSGNNHNAGDLSSHDDMTFKSFVVDGKRTLQAGDYNLVTFGGEYRSEKYDSTRLENGSSVP